MRYTSQCLYEMLINQICEDGNFKGDVINIPVTCRQIMKLYRKHPEISNRDIIFDFFVDDVLINESMLTEIFAFISKNKISTCLYYNLPCSCVYDSHFELVKVDARNLDKCKNISNRKLNNM